MESPLSHLHLYGEAEWAPVDACPTVSFLHPNAHCPHLLRNTALTLHWAYVTQEGMQPARS